MGARLPRAPSGSTSGCSLGRSAPGDAESIPLDRASLDPRGRRARLPAGIRGLLFDLCNVLYDNTLWRRWLLQLLSHLGLHTNYRCFFKVWDRDFLDDVHRGRRTFSDAFDAFLRSVGLSPGQIDEVKAACQSRRLQMETTARLLPGVKHTLASLKQAGLALGAIGNSEHPAAVLSRRLSGLGLAETFAAIVSSIELRRTMPDPACYHVAVRGMGLPADQVAFVGHDTAELAGAADAGLATVAFNFEPDAEADVYLERFEELLQVLPKRSPLAAVG